MSGNAYMRTRGGKKIHRADCWTLRRAGALTVAATPWRWADGKDLNTLIRDFVNEVGQDRSVQVCGHCFTVTEQSRWWFRVHGDAT